MSLPLCLSVRRAPFSQRIRLHALPHSHGSWWQTALLEWVPQDTYLQKIYCSKPSLRTQLVFGVLAAKSNPWRMCKTTTYILYMLDILFRIITMHCSFRAATPSRIFKAKFMLLCLYCYIAPEGPLWTPKWNTEQNQHLLTQLSCRNIWCIDRFEKRPLRYVDTPLRRQHSSSLLTLVDMLVILNLRRTTFRVPQGRNEY